MWKKQNEHFILVIAGGKITSDLQFLICTFLYFPHFSFP